MTPVHQRTHGKILIGRFLGIPEFLYLYGSSDADSYSIFRRIGQTFSLNRYLEIGRIRINSLPIRIAIWLLLSYFPIMMFSLFGIPANKGMYQFTVLWGATLLLTGWPSLLYSLPVWERARNYFEYIKSSDPLAFLNPDIKSEVDALGISSRDAYYYGQGIKADILLQLMKSKDFELYDCDDFINSGLSLRTERYSFNETLEGRLRDLKRYDVIQYFENHRKSSGTKFPIKPNETMGYGSRS